jgi:hypothetical protein
MNLVWTESSYVGCIIGKRNMESYFRARPGICFSFFPNPKSTGFYKLTRNFNHVCWHSDAIVRLKLIRGYVTLQAGNLSVEKSRVQPDLMHGAPSDHCLYVAQYNTKVHELSNELTPWSRVLLEKPAVAQLLRNFPTFYRTRRIIAVFTIAHHRTLH